MTTRIDPMYFKLPDSDDDPVYQEALRLFDYYDDLRTDVLEYVSAHGVDIYQGLNVNIVRSVMEGLWDPVPDFNQHWMAAMVASILYMRSVTDANGVPEDGAMDTIMLSNRSVIKDRCVLVIDGIVRWNIPLRDDGYGVLLPKVKYQVSMRREHNTKNIYLGIESMVGKKDIPEYQPILIC